ncbi:MAG: hypothetical protein Q7S50_00500 [bacterium]|nr:hypothetical protein [bacterium]
MNKNILIGGIVVIIIAALGIWYFSPSNNDVTETQGTTGNTAVKPTGSNTFRSIFTQSGNHECLYEQVSSSGKSSSRVYIADGKMRGEFRTVSSNETSANLMIYDGGFLYSWKEGATVGKKSSIKSISELPQVIPNDLTSGANFGVSADNVGWDCHDWAKDVKFFVIPTYVKFSAGS